MEELLQRMRPVLLLAARQLLLRLLELLLQLVAKLVVLLAAGLVPVFVLVSFLPAPAERTGLTEFIQDDGDARHGVLEGGGRILGRDDGKASRVLSGLKED